MQLEDRRWAALNGQGVDRTGAPPEDAAAWSSSATFGELAMRLFLLAALLGVVTRARADCSSICSETYDKCLKICGKTDTNCAADCNKRWETCKTRCK